MVVFTFDGKPIYFKKMRDRWLNNRVSEITVIPYVGYMPEIKSYVFQDFGFNQGRLYQKTFITICQLVKSESKPSLQVTVCHWLKSSIQNGLITFTRSFQITAWLF